MSDLHKPHIEIVEFGDDPLTGRFELRLSPRMLDHLKRIAEAEETSIAEVIRVFCASGINQWRQLSDEQR